MKTLSELRIDARSLFNETDASNSHITNTQLTAWCNEAYRYILTKLKTLPKKENDLTAALGDIALAEGVLTIDEAYILNPDTAKYDKLDVIDLSVLRYINPGWLSEDASVPSYLVRKDTFVGYLFPQPKTSYVGKNIRTYGMEFPTELSGDSDTPSKLSLNLIDALPHFMAYRAFSQLERPNDAGNELTIFRSMVKDQREISTVNSHSDQKWIGADNDDTI
jgi:hypothetical protein